MMPTSALSSSQLPFSTLSAPLSMSSHKRGRTDGHLSKEQYNAGGGGALSLTQVSAVCVVCCLRQETDAAYEADDRIGGSSLE